MIDADDTLWHSNIYYEQATIDFAETMEQVGFSWNFVEKVFRLKEKQNNHKLGHSYVSLTNSMIETYEEICKKTGRMVDFQLVCDLEEKAAITRDFPIHFLSGVKDTLPILSANQQLFIILIGNQLEQQAKLMRSGLKKFFQKIIIVREKSKKVYEQILKNFNLKPDDTWMIGNSPKADVNPAKAIGMRTVLIPYRSTSSFENEKIDNTVQRTVVLRDFSDLLILFNLYAA
jgi:putative hydrolase of the HAD superfamily